MNPDLKYFRLRLPEDLREFVREAATVNQRSMTGEIIFALRERQKTASGASQG